MTTEWFLERHGGVRGPYTADKLQALVQRGEVRPDDLIRQGMDGRPVPASKVKGLFPSTPIRSAQPPAKSTPTIPVANATSVEVRPAEDVALNSTAKTKGDRRKNASAKVRVMVNRLATDSRAAALLTAKRTDRLRVTQVSLPQAYRDLGKAIHSAQQHRSTFPDLYAEIDESLQRIQELRQVRPAKETEGFSGRAKAVAATARNAAAAKAVSLKLAGQFRSLGEAVYEKDGQSSGPSLLTSAIAEHRQHIATLDAEIAAIEQPYAGRTFTPRRLAIAGALVLGLLSFLGLSSFLGWSSHGTAASNATLVATDVGLSTGRLSKSETTMAATATPSIKSQGRTTALSLANGRPSVDKFLEYMNVAGGLKIHSIHGPDDLEGTPFARFNDILQQRCRIHVGEVENAYTSLTTHVSLFIAEPESDKEVSALVLATQIDFDNDPHFGPSNLRALRSIVERVLPEANFVDILKKRPNMLWTGQWANETFGKAAITERYNRNTHEFLVIIIVEPTAKKSDDGSEKQSSVTPERDAASRIASAPSNDVITEDFFPSSPPPRIYETHWFADPTINVNERFERRRVQFAPTVVSRVIQEGTAVNGSAEWTTCDKDSAVIFSSGDHVRQNAGCIEFGHDWDASRTLWYPFLKWGAHTGDSWTWTHPVLPEAQQNTYTVGAFSSWHGVPSVEVIEVSRQQLAGLPNLYRTIRLYAKGLGLVEILNQWQSKTTATTVLLTDKSSRPITDVKDLPNVQREERSETITPKVSEPSKVASAENLRAEAKRRASGPLADALDGEAFVKCIRVESVGGPTVIEKDESKAKIRVRVKFQTDAQAYHHFAESVQKALDRIALQKGAFSVLGPIGGLAEQFNRSRGLGYDTGQWHNVYAGELDVRFWADKIGLKRERARGRQDQKSAAMNKSQGLLQSVLVGVNTEKAATLDGSEWTYFRVPLDASLALAAAASTGFFVELRLVDKLNETVATNRFPAEINDRSRWYVRASTIYGGASPTNYRADSFQPGFDAEYYEFLKTPGKRSRPRYYLIAPLFFDLSYRESVYVPEFTIERELTLPLEKWNRVETVKCEAAF
jgi:hypothetical protein